MANQFLPNPNSTGPNSNQARAISLHRRVRNMIDDDPTALLGVLAAIAQDARAKDGDRIAAVRELLDRGYGRAVNVHLTGDGAAEMPRIDIAIAALIGELRGETPGNGHHDLPLLEAGTTNGPEGPPVSSG